jgi:hypothetical protein
MMHVMVVMIVVVMMMMVMGHRWFGIHRRCPGRRAGRCFLRDGVSGEADGESGRDDKALDHGKTFLWLGNPNGSQRSIEVSA